MHGIFSGIFPKVTCRIDPCESLPRRLFLHLAGAVFGGAGGFVNAFFHAPLDLAIKLLAGVLCAAAGIFHVLTGGLLLRHGIGADSGEYQGEKQNFHGDFL